METKQYNLRYVTGLSLVSALGGLLFGYDWVVIGGAKPFYEQFFGIADIPSMQGWAVSCALVGCVAGAVLAGMLSDKYGRKLLLLASAALFLISAIGVGATDSFAVFVVFRIIGGVGIGLASNLSPVYIAELAPAPIRGRFVAINQLTIVIGILMAQVVNWLIAEPVGADASGADILASWNGQMAWRYMFWAGAVPAILFLVLMFFVPDSPRWLALRGLEPKAHEILKKVGGQQYAEQSMLDIRQTAHVNDDKVRLNSLFNRSVLPVVLIGITLAVLQQWCGINVIFLYADEVFSSAGYAVSDMLFNVVITGSVNLVFTVLAMWLVDRIGRKVLLYIGNGGLALLFLLSGIMFKWGIQGTPQLVVVLLAIACYGMTLAPVTWVVLSEIFPNKIRGAAMAAATFALWIANALLAYFFPIVNTSIGVSGTFLVFAGICAAGLLFVWLFVRETKGKTLEEIEKEFVR